MKRSFHTLRNPWLEVGFCYMHSGLLKCGTNGIQFGCLGQSHCEQSTLSLSCKFINWGRVKGSFHIFRYPWLEVGFCYMHSGLLKCGTNGIQFGCLGQSCCEHVKGFSLSCKFINWGRVKGSFHIFRYPWLEVGFCYMHSGLLKCGTNGIQFGCLGQSRREQSTFFSPSLYDVSLSLCMEPPLRIH